MTLVVDDRPPEWTWMDSILVVVIRKLIDLNLVRLPRKHPSALRGGWVYGRV